jgi:hypothetical protein
MPLGPDPQAGLLGLVEALRSGMDPNTAFSVGSSLQDEQRARMAARTERLQGLAGLLTQAAGAGTTYEGAESLLDSQPGPMGPAIQQMLESAYPQNEVPQSNMYGGMPQGPPQPEPMQQSPIYTGNPQAVMANETSALQLQGMQADLMGAQAEAQIAPEWTAFQADAMRAKAEGQTIDQFMARVNSSPGNASLLQSDPNKVQAILENTFGHYPVQGMGSQPTG